MNCPVCGTSCAESVNYCPTCGTPLHASSPEPKPIYVEPATPAVPQYQPQPVVQPQPQVQPQTQAMPMYGEPVPQPSPAQYAEPMPQYQPTQQMPSPQYGQQGYMPQQYAVPMNQPVPPMGRSIDMGQKKKSPKWPIVLIVLLVLLIAAAIVLLVLQPWNVKVDDGTATVTDGGVVVTSQPDEPAQQPVVIGRPAAPEVVEGSQPAAPAPSNDEQIHAQLTGIYDTFAGYDSRIGEVVEFFNGYYPDYAEADALQAEFATAQAIQSELANQAATLNAIVLPEGSAYAQALANLKTLNNDLSVRITDLVDSLAAWSAGDMGAAAECLTRHNENGVSTYKSEYVSLYPNARP